MAAAARQLERERFPSVIDEDVAAAADACLEGAASDQNAAPKAGEFVEVYEGEAAAK